MPEVSVGDVTLAYEVKGEGEPVLLIAGCGQPAVAWQLSLVPALVGAGYQVATYDNRGVAPSSSPDAPYSVEEMTADAVALLDHLGWHEPVRVAGHSLGGWIAETLVLDHPGRVRSAALMGSANKPTAWEIAITTVERDVARSGVDLPPLFFATQTLRYLPIADIQNDDVVSLWLTFTADLPVWPNISVPCLVLAFEHDVDSPPEKARQAASTIPGCEYREVEGAGHIGIITHADDVARHLIDFFDRR
jgi:pimeloyl-ACP methyl ester carboxylesterase